MANEQVVAEDSPKLGVEPHKSTGPVTGNAEITNMIVGLLDDNGDAAPEQQAAQEPKPQPAPTRIDPKEETVAPKADAPSLPFVPPQALGVKPTEPKDDIDDEYEPPEAKGDTKAAHAWRSVKQERKQLRDKVKELEAALQTKPAVEEQKTPEEMLTLRNQVQELEAKLGEYDLASTSTFKQQFEAPIRQVVKRGANILVRSGKSAEDANSIMAKITDPRLSMDQIQDIIADEPMAVQGALMTAVSEFGELADRRNEALKHWKETKAALKDHESRESEVKLVQDVEQNTHAALQKVLAEGNWMYAPGDNPQWNAQVQERVAAAKGILRTASREDLVKYVLEGVTARPLRQMFEETYKLAEQRKAELDRLVARQPGYRGPSADPTPRDPAKLEKGKPMQIGDAVNSVFSGLESHRL